MLANNLNRGFTILEMVLVIAILSGLLGLGIYSFRPTTLFSDANKIKSDLEVGLINNALKAYYSEKGRYPDVFNSISSGTYEICRYNLEPCPTAGINLDILVDEKFIPEIPIRSYDNPNFTGYKVLYLSTADNYERDYYLAFASDGDLAQVVIPTPSSQNADNALLSGRVGGQTLHGGKEAGENLTLRSTSNTSKGKIFFGTSAYDEANDRLGVGNTSPGSRLVVKGISATSATSALNVLNSAETSALFVRDDRNVGIGTTSPNANLEIAHNGAGTFGVALRLNQNTIGNSDGPKIAFNKTMTASKKWTAGILDGVNVGDFAISEDGDYTGGFGTPRLTVRAGGNVGIGTTNPTSKLSIASTSDLFSSNNPNLGKKMFGSQTFIFTADNQIKKVLQFSNPDNGFKSGVLYGTVTLVFSGMETNNANPRTYVRKYNVRVRDWYAGTPYPMNAYIESIFEEGGSNKITLDVESSTSTLLVLKAKIVQNDGTFDPNSQLTVSYDFTGSSIVAGNFITPSFADGTAASGDPATQGAVILAGSTGNVGIGTTNPLSKLDVIGDVTIGTSLRGNYSGTGLGVKNRLTWYPNNWTDNVSQYLAWMNMDPSANIFYMQTLQNNGTNSGSISMQPYGGNVGIGTANPGAKLDITANNEYLGLIVKGTGVNYSVLDGLRIAGSDNAAGWGNTIWSGTNNIGITADSGYKIALSRTSDWTTGLVVDTTNGYVGIGTTAPFEKLHVADGGLYLGPDFHDGTYGKAIRIGWEGDADVYHSIQTTISQGGAAANGMRFYVHGGGATDNQVLGMALTGGGNVGIGTTSPGSHRLSVLGTAGLSSGTAWTNTSDSRLKNVETNLKESSILDKLLKLNPVSFRWNDLHNSLYGSDKTKLNYGFVAQEVEPIFPDMITTDENGYKWYNPSGFEAVLTASIQSQQTQITSNTQKVAEVANDLKDVQQKLEILTNKIEPKVIFNSKSGTTVLSESKTSVFVQTTEIRIDSLVMVTSETVIPYALAVTEKVPNQGFRVEIPESAQKDIKFSWLII